MPLNAAAGDRPRTDSSSAPPRALTPLASRLVRYDDGPDRRTVYPPGLSGNARMATWLSADSDAFVDLDAAR